MGDKSNIAWTDATLNFVYGCEKVSPACANCYAVGTVRRLTDLGHHDLLPAVMGADRDWTGTLVLKADRMEQALRWKKPRLVFVNSLSDTFHPAIPDEVLDRLWAVMAATPQHTYQILTKRPERMLAYLSGSWQTRIIPMLRLYQNGLKAGGRGVMLETKNGSLPNVWIGVTVENQAMADERIPLLLQTPAAVRFVSMEPLLGPVDIRQWTPRLHEDGTPFFSQRYGYFTPLDWVIVGGESGPNARPMHPDWVRDLRDQCQATGTPFFFKQWGEWAPHPRRDNAAGLDPEGDWYGRDLAKFNPAQFSLKVGKRNAGHLLDGVEHHAWPEGVDR